MVWKKKHVPSWDSHGVTNTIELPFRLASVPGKQALLVYHTSGVIILPLHSIPLRPNEWGPIHHKSRVPEQQAVFIALVSCEPHW